MRRLMGLSLKSCVEICEAELGRKLPDDFVEKMQAVTYQSFRDAPLQPVAGVKDADRSPCRRPGSTPAWQARARRRRCASRSASPACGTCSRAASSARARCRAESRFPISSCMPRIAMNVQPFDCVVVEDSVPGVQAARSAGMRALAYAGAPYANRDALRAGGRRTVRRHEAAARAGARHDRLMVHGHGQGRARHRGRRRHGGAGRRAAAARFGFRRHRARGAQAHRRPHLDRRLAGRAARSRRLVGAWRRRQSAGAVVRQARRRAWSNRRATGC